MTDWKDTLRELELALLSSSVRKDAAAVQRYLAEEFREFGSSGRVFSRAAIVAELAAEPVASWSMQEFEAVMLEQGVALVTYRTVRTAGESASVASLRSSVWVLREGQWQMLFHQGTRVG